MHQRDSINNVSLNRDRTCRTETLSHLEDSARWTQDKISAQIYIATLHKRPDLTDIQHKLDDLFVLCSMTHYFRFNKKKLNSACLMKTYQHKLSKQLHVCTSDLIPLRCYAWRTINNCVASHWKLLTVYITKWSRICTFLLSLNTEIITAGIFFLVQHDNICICNFKTVVICFDFCCL